MVETSICPHMKACEQRRSLDGQYARKDMSVRDTDVEKRGPVLLESAYWLVSPVVLLQSTQFDFEKCDDMEPRCS